MIVVAVAFSFLSLSIVENLKNIKHDDRMKKIGIGKHKNKMFAESTDGCA